MREIEDLILKYKRRTHNADTGARLTDRSALVRICMVAGVGSVSCKVAVAIAVTVDAEVIPRQPMSRCPYCHDYGNSSPPEDWVAVLLTAEYCLGRRTSL